ncbi:MAG: HIT domain-containing protein [Marmoricola sp.]
MNAGADDALQRLWTPYRMAYIAGEGSAERHVPAGCPFCAMREPQDGDLVVHRGREVFAVLNLHPYNPGHLMVLPYRHVGDLGELSADEAAELHDVTTRAVATLRSVSSPDAFNIGLNLGAAAGGSLSAHLHQHVVPRWTGDANFITVIGRTKTLPQLLEDTARLLVEAWTAP